MLKKRQKYHPISRLNTSIYLSLSTLIFTLNSTVCYAFSSSTSPSPSSPLSESPQSPTNLIAQGISGIVPEITSILETGSAAIIEIIPGTMPVSVYEPYEPPVTKSVTEPVTDRGDGIARDPEPSPYESPTLLRELFSLKAVRQSVNIALPPEAELAALPELPFNKMLPGVVGQTDHEIDGRWVDFYQFEGNQDQQVVVMLRNSQDARPTNNLRLTPYAMVFDPNGQVMAATVIPGSYRLSTPDPLLPLDNQLALRLPQSGRYVVAVFTNRGEDGRYGIGWNQDNHRFSYDEIHELANAEFNPPVEITGKANQIVQIHAISYQFDPVVRLIDANGNVIAEDDDNGGNYNSRIEVTLPADGTYQAIVTSADGHQQGQYRLRMR